MQRLLVKIKGISNILLTRSRKTSSYSLLKRIFLVVPFQYYLLIIRYLSNDTY